MEVSNRTLAVLLVAAIVFSVGGTLMSFGKVATDGVTGYSTNNESGTLALTVQDSLSITLVTTSINFGNCQLNATRDSIFNSSSDNSFSSIHDNFLCSGGGINIPSNFTVENNGNVDTNITVRTDANGTTVFNNPNSAIGFYAINVSGRPGCEGAAQVTPQNLTLINTDYEFCGNLTYQDTNDQVAFIAYNQLNSSSTGGSTAINITFEGHVIS